MNMLKNSQGADVNYGEALKYSKTVIDGGFQPTMRNYKLLLQTIRRSAKKKQNYIKDKNDLGLLYYRIQGSNAIHYFVFAANGQYLEAFYNLV